jgi:hypothetical protein
MIRLLTAHKILVAACLVLAAILILWGVRHRAQPNAWVAIAIGATVLPVGTWYLRKLFRAPPLK